MKLKYIIIYQLKTMNSNTTAYMGPGPAMGPPNGYYNGVPYNNGPNQAYQQGYVAGQ